MRDRLKHRLPLASEYEIEAIASLLERYGIEPKISNLDGNGFLFTDVKGRTARVCEGIWREKQIHLQDPKADIAIIIIDGMVAGWIESKKLEDLQDRFIVDIKSLSPLPEDFSFDQYCPHLTEFGGVSDGKNWTCFGCEKKLVFNDN